MQLSVSNDVGTTGHVMQESPLSEVVASAVLSNNLSWFTWFKLFCCLTLTFHHHVELIAIFITLFNNIITRFMPAVL